METAESSRFLRFSSKAGPAQTVRFTDELLQGHNRQQRTDRQIGRIQLKQPVQNPDKAHADKTGERMDSDKHAVQKEHACFHVPVLSGQSIVSFQPFLNLHLVTKQNGNSSSLMLRSLAVKEEIN